MRISEKGITLIKTFEGFRSTAYTDQAGVWTIGYGTTRVNGKPVTPGMVCGEEQALIWLVIDTQKFELAVNTLTENKFKNDNDQCKFDALVSFTYNLGPGALAASTLLKKVKANIPVLESNFTDWSKIRINGIMTPSPGLVRRRKAEYTLFSKGILQFNF